MKSSGRIERESLRSGRLTLTASAVDPVGEPWAGVYAAYFLGTFHANPTVAPATFGMLVLGK